MGTPHRGACAVFDLWFHGFGADAVRGRLRTAHVFLDADARLVEVASRARTKTRGYTGRRDIAGGFVRRLTPVPGYFPGAPTLTRRAVWTGW